MNNILNKTMNTITNKYNILPYPHLIQENILKDDFAKKLQNEILNIEDKEWDRYNNPFEQKFTLRNKYNFPNNLKLLFKYLTSDKFVNNLSKIVDIKLINDPNRNFLGVHKYNNGDYLDIHVDAGLHPKTKQKKQITLGIYLSKNWKEENGGHLELWEGENSSNNNAKLFECKQKVLPSFNKLVIFKNNDYSWHGNPIPVKCNNNNEKRIFVTLSYLSEEFFDLNKKQKAFFIKRPNDPEDLEKDKLRLLRADPEKYKEIYNIKK